MSLTVFPDPLVSTNPDTRQQTPWSLPTLIPDSDALRHRQVGEEGSVFRADLKRELGFGSLLRVQQIHRKGWEPRTVLEH